MDDLISRQAAIENYQRVCRKVACNDCPLLIHVTETLTDCELERFLHNLPSAQPTLYGYKIEHLAYIAKVMQKEGVTAEYAVRTFDDMSRAIKMIIDETQQKVEEALNEINFRP